MTRLGNVIRSCAVISGILAIVLVAFVLSERSFVRRQSTSAKLQLQVMHLDGNCKIVPCSGAFVEVVRQRSSPVVPSPPRQVLQPIVLDPDRIQPVGNCIVRRGQWVELAQHPQDSNQPPHFFMIRDGLYSEPTNLMSTRVRIRVRDSTKALIVCDVFEPEFRVVLFVSDHDESAISDSNGTVNLHLKGPGSPEVLVRIRHPRFPERSACVQVSSPRTNTMAIPIVVKTWEMD